MIFIYITTRLGLYTLAPFLRENQQKCSCCPTLRSGNKREPARTERLARRPAVLLGALQGAQRLPQSFFARSHVVPKTPGRTGEIVALQTPPPCWRSWCALGQLCTILYRKISYLTKNRCHSLWAPCKAPNSTAGRLARRPAGFFSYAILSLSRSGGALRGAPLSHVARGALQGTISDTRPNCRD